MSGNRTITVNKDWTIGEFCIWVSADFPELKFVDEVELVMRKAVALTEANKASRKVIDEIKAERATYLKEAKELYRENKLLKEKIQDMKKAIHIIAGM